MEWRVEIACQTGGISPDASACYKAVTGCTDANGQLAGGGVMYAVFAHPVGSPAPWTFRYNTCFPDTLPGAVVPNPPPTMAQIIDAFHTTPWAKATITTQPAGNITLVGLDTYYATTWQAAGYQPEEIETFTLGGYQVRVKPTLTGYTYTFGDGDTFGPTTDPGGTYPNGGITHAYQEPGTYSTHVAVTFGGQVSINGSPWLPIPDTVTIPMPDTTVQVKTAQAQLIPNPDGH